MEIDIVKMDNLGRGIGYLNNKIIFVPKSFPVDRLKVEIVKEKKNYLEGKIEKIITPSKKRVKPICPYFLECGGCDLLHIPLSEALFYKLEKVKAILKTFGINYEVKKIIKSKERYNYRNKLSLKVVNGKISFYESESHREVEISSCYLAKTKINELIKDLSKLRIQNGLITIRVNYKNEIILIIKSKDEVSIPKTLINNYSLVGIIYNDKCLYGEDYFMEKVLDYIFKVSYNSFFQVNLSICEELFKLVSKYTINSLKVLDLYCGVGTLSVVASGNAQKVVGIEIVENAIKDANLNKKINNLNNLEFICDNTSWAVNKINSEYDTIILDPPRSGVSKRVIEKIKEAKIAKIIYISCDPFTLGRDLNLLLDLYQIQDFVLLDMFPNTKHVESFCILNLKG